MFSYIKLKLANYILQREIRKNNRVAQVVSVSKTKTLALLFDANNSQDILVVKSFLKYFLNRDIDVYVFGFVNKRKMEDIHLSTIHVNYFNLQDLNLIGIPNSKKFNLFIKKKYEILINLSLKNSFPTKYLALKSNSKYRIGIFTDRNNRDYDLMMKLKIKSLDFFKKHLIHYLEIIDKNNEK